MVRTGNAHHVTSEYFVEKVNKKKTIQKQLQTGKNTVMVNGWTRLLHWMKSEQWKKRLPGDAELNRTLGGGIVPGSLVLIAGEPVLANQLCFYKTVYGLKDVTVLYISGEESEQQIRMRADRLRDLMPHPKSR